MTRTLNGQGGRAGGFTLLEVMITLGILATGLLAMLSLQVRALGEGSRGRHTTAAAMIARDQVELIQRMPFSDADLVPQAPPVWATPPWLANTSDPELNPGEVAVRVNQTAGTSTVLIYTVNYRVLPDAGGNTDIRNVDVEVLWNELGVSNNRPTRTGQPTAALSTVLVNNDR
jgi:prepilin-type N-terminal cleavage/methylation domain-containing protein